MAIDWLQVGQDFQQKYQGTYCRYISPVSKTREVFQVAQVIPREDEGPNIVLFNLRAGELYLNYKTEAELDFSFPDCSNFIHDKKAFRFARNFLRQWKKGVCNQTAHIVFPYNEIYPSHNPAFSYDILESAYKTKRHISLKEAIALIENENYFSVVLNDHLSLGLSDNKNDLWLWYDVAIIAKVVKKPGAPLREIHMITPEFKQEVMDYLKQVDDNARTVI